MLSPHESLSLNPKRGLLAAVLGNPATHPGLVSLYDVSQDCRHPKLQSTSPVARLGHESGFAPDGKTFYAGVATSGGSARRAVSTRAGSCPSPAPSANRSLSAGNWPLASSAGSARTSTITRKGAVRRNTVRHPTRTPARVAPVHAG